jgi:hypothetical protein
MNLSNRSPKYLQNPIDVFTDRDVLRQLETGLKFLNQNWNLALVEYCVAIRVDESKAARVAPLR